MSEELVNSLVITGIGMGLVFFTIILLWGMMEALVRFSPRMENDDIPGSAKGMQRSDPETEHELESAKQAAVAMAVAVALALYGQKPQDISGKPTQALSPWQSVMRADRFQQHHSTYTRKFKGVPGNENKS